ncbi:hypothetical protein B0H19DRAFT_1258634 [Mycena capillaripes]|nr:hypothetical protein B0H19DRAFT_1258634 [Mycena capillaripes]
MTEMAAPEYSGYPATAPTHLSPLPTDCYRCGNIDHIARASPTAAAATATTETALQLHRWRGQDCVSERCTQPRLTGATGLFDYAFITVDDSTVAPLGVSARLARPRSQNPNPNRRPNRRRSHRRTRFHRSHVTILRRKCRRRTWSSPFAPLQGDDAPQTRPGRARPTDIQPFTEQAPSQLSATPGSDKMRA